MCFINKGKLPKDEVQNQTLAESSENKNNNSKSMAILTRHANILDCGNINDMAGRYDLVKESSKKIPPDVKYNVYKSLSSVYGKELDNNNKNKNSFSLSNINNNLNVTDSNISIVDVLVTKLEVLSNYNASLFVRMSKQLLKYNNSMQENKPMEFDEVNTIVEKLMQDAFAYKSGTFFKDIFYNKRRCCDMSLRDIVLRQTETTSMSPIKRIKSLDLNDTERSIDDGADVNQDEYENSFDSCTSIDSNNSNTAGDFDLNVVDSNSDSVTCSNYEDSDNEADYRMRIQGILLKENKSEGCIDSYGELQACSMSCSSVRPAVTFPSASPTKRHLKHQGKYTSILASRSISNDNIRQCMEKGGKKTNVSSQIYRF